MSLRKCLLRKYAGWPILLFLFARIVCQQEHRIQKRDDWIWLHFFSYQPQSYSINTSFHTSHKQSYSINTSLDVLSSLELNQLTLFFGYNWQAMQFILKFEVLKFELKLSLIKSHFFGYNWQLTIDLTSYAVCFEVWCVWLTVFSRIQALWPLIELNWSCHY